MARTPEQQAAVDAARAAKKQQVAGVAPVGARDAGAQAFGKIADTVAPPAQPGIRAFDAMVGPATGYPQHTIAFPNAGPQLPGGMASNAGPEYPGRMRPNAGPQMPPAAPAAAPPTFYGTASGIATDRGAAEAVRRLTHAGPQLPGGMAPNAGPQLPGGMAPNAGPQFPGGMTPNTGPQLPGGMTPNAGPQMPVKPPVKPTLAMRAEPIIHGLAPGIAGALTAGAVNDGRQKEAEAQYAKTVAAAQPYTAKPGEIPKAIDGTVPQAGPAPVAGSFLNQSEAGRNVGNALMALPGGGLGIKAAQTALTALPIAARGVRAAQTAVPATVAAAQGFAGGDANFPGRSTAPVEQQLPQASYSNEHRREATTPPFDPAGKIIKTVGKDGKVSYGGADIKFGADIYTPDGKLVNGGDPNNPKGFGVTSLDSSEGLRQDKMELQRLQGERAEREAGFAGNQPGGGLGGISGATMSSSLRDTTESGRGTTISDLIAQKRALKQDTINAQREGNAMQAATMRANNQATVEAQRYSADLGARTARENNQMQRESNQLQREIAMGQREYQRRKDAIELGMKEREFQTGRSDKEFEQKAAREKSLQSKIDQRFTAMGPDGKPVVDANKTRLFRETMDRAVARMGGKGLQDLSPADEEKLFAATDLLQRVQANASNINPLKPDLLRTIDALDLTNLQQDPKTGDFVINSDNPKVHGQVIPKRFLQTEEAHFFTLGGMRGTPTNRFDMLTNGARQ